jgi:hypothetical protein
MERGLRCGVVFVDGGRLVSLELSVPLDRYELALGSMGAGEADPRRVFQRLFSKIDCSGG